MRRHTRPLAGVLLLLVLFALALGCREEVPPLFRRNNSPETTLTIVPEDSAQGFYRYHVYWRGEDSDGRIVRYIFSISDTLSHDEEDNWDPTRFEDRERSVYTDKTDSIFIFDSKRGRQAFSISAVDDFGEVDVTPARGFFRIIDNGLPQVRFIDVQGFRPGTLLPPCGVGVGCTIPTYTNFKVRFTGITPNGRVTGYQWQRVPPAPRTPGAFEPFGEDSLYLDWDAGGRAEGRGDTTGFSFAGDTLWTLQDDTLTVYHYNTSLDSAVRSGDFKIRARVRDDARQESLFLPHGELFVTLNYDPNTRLQRIAARDCPRCALPNPPAYCSTNDSLRVGYIVGHDQESLPDTTQWRVFCEGDTLPVLPHLRFYASGGDNPKDLPRNGTALRRPRFSANFEWVAGVPPNQLVNRVMPFSNDSTDVEGNFHLPNGQNYTGWVHGWGTDSLFQGACPFDFTYFVAAVDENGKRDGTPDSIPFYVSGSPTIDSTTVPLVLVLAPRCSAAFTPFCPVTDGMTFGPDTLLIVGTHIADDPLNPQTPLGFGFNRFQIPFRVFGHDHPRDRPPLVREDLWGRIRAWLFDYVCLEPACVDLPVSGAGVWRDDRFDPNVFDDSLQVTFSLDTLCTTSSPCGFNVKAALPTGSFGTYRFDLQGRDTNALGATCSEPSDLGPNPSSFARPISDYGRFTAPFTRQVVMRQLQEVRPYVIRTAKAAAAERAAKARTARASTARKGWWKR